MTVTSIGTRVRDAREKANLSLTEVAERSFIDLDKLSKVEHGKRQLASSEIVAVASILGVRPEALMHDPARLLRRDPTRQGGQEALNLFNEYAANWRLLNGLAAVFDPETRQAEDQ